MPIIRCLVVQPRFQLLTSTIFVIIVLKRKIDFFFRLQRFQGQQNDYILLSLVRTKNVGHLRDIRRLVVAMSRARLGKTIKL